MHALRIGFVVAVSWLVFQAGAAWAGVYRQEGTVELHNWEGEAGKKLGVIQVKYTFDTIVGEPTEHFRLRYVPIDDATELLTIKLRARVLSEGQRMNAFVDINPLVPQPGEWGWDVPASPNWGPGPQAWKPAYGSMFQTEAGGPVTAKAAKNIYRRGFSLVDLEVVEIRFKTQPQERNAWREQRPPDNAIANRDGSPWLRTPFHRQQLGQGYVPAAVGDHMRQSARGFTVFVEQPVTAESNIPFSDRESKAYRWQAEDYAYAQLRFQWRRWAGNKHIGGPVAAKVAIVWETDELAANLEASAKNQRIVTFTTNMQLKPGDEFTIVDRMPLTTVEKSQLRPKLVVTADIPGDSQVVKAKPENPLASLKQKRELPPHNPLANLAKDQAEESTTQAETTSEPEAQSQARYFYVRAVSGYSCKHKGWDPDPSWSRSRSDEEWEMLKQRREERARVLKRFSDQVSRSPVYKARIPDHISQSFSWTGNLNEAQENLMYDWAEAFPGPTFRYEPQNPGVTFKPVKFFVMTTDEEHANDAYGRENPVVNYHAPPFERLFELSTSK